MIYGSVFVSGSRLLNDERKSKTITATMRNEKKSTDNHDNDNDKQNKSTDPIDKCQLLRTTKNEKDEKEKQTKKCLSKIKSH